MGSQRGLVRTHPQQPLTIGLLEEHRARCHRGGGLGARSSPSPLRCPPPTPQHAAQPRKTAVDTPVREAAGLTGRQASRPPSAGAGREGVRWGPEAVGTGRERLGLPRVRDLACRPELLWAPRRVGQTCRPQPGPDTSREMGLAGCTLKATQGARGATRACPPPPRTPQQAPPPTPPPHTPRRASSCRPNPPPPRTGRLTEPGHRTTSSHRTLCTGLPQRLDPNLPLSCGDQSYVQQPGPCSIQGEWQRLWEAWPDPRARGGVEGKPHSRGHNQHQPRPQS